MGNNKPLLWTVILAAAGAESANAQITGTPEAGSYYFKNVDSGMFLGGANSWGTQASLIKHGIVFKVELDNGKYTLDSNVSNGGDNHYFTGTFVDGGKTPVEITETESGIYVMKIGDSYIIADGSIIKSDGTDETKAVKWQIIPVADLTKAFENASFESPADATFLIKGANFSRYHGENSAWQGSPTIGRGDNTPDDAESNKNFVAEAFNKNFDVYQEISDLPEGLYRLNAQVFYRYGGYNDAANAHNDGNEVINAKLYANSSVSDVPSIFKDAAESADASKGLRTGTVAGFVPNSMLDASKAFSAGLYKSEPVYVYVKEGEKLRIGIKNENHATNDWTLFDNFELYYIGNVNIDAVREELTNKLAVQINKAGKYTDDDSLRVLAVEAAKLQTVINTITTDNKDAYVMAANYQSGVKGNIGEQIEELGAKISKATANYEAWVAAQKAHKDVLTPKLAELTEIYNAAAEETRNNIKDTYDSRVVSVAGFLQDAKEAYEANEAGVLFSEENLNTKVESIIGSIDEAIKAISEGSTNAISHANVKNKIATETRFVYSDEAAKLYALLSGAPKDGEIYADLYLEALGKLSSVKRDIDAVEAENEAAYDAESANEETQADFYERLNKAEADLVAITAEYTERVGTVENPAEGTLRANYKVACEDVEAITAELKAEIEDFIGEREDVKAFYNDKVSEIKSNIEALQANVDAANKAHEIKGEAPFCEKYSEDKAAIKKSIDDLLVLVGKSVAEHDANAASVDAINAVRKNYNDAKKVVDEQKENDYTTSGRFAASEKVIEDAIAALEVAAMNAYKVDGTGSAADFFDKIVDDETIVNDETNEEVTRLGTATINIKIDEYKANAEASFNAYKIIAEALDNYGVLLNGKEAEGTEGEEGYVPAVEGLIDIVKIEDVTIDGSFDGKTYKTAIEEVKARIKAIEDKLSEAKGKEDVEHKNAITAIDVDADIETVINDLKANYADMETAWNEAQLIAAKERLLAEAQRRVEEIVLVENYDPEVYGKSATELNEENDRIKAELEEIRKQITTVDEKTDPEAIAILSDVVNKIEEENGIRSAYNTLVDKADKALTEYTADQEALKALNTEVERISVLLNGGNYNKVDYKGVAATDNDKGRFTDEIANVQALIDGINSEIAVSDTDETVRTDRADQTGEDGKVVLGYDSRLKAVEVQINNLLVLAGYEVANDKALTDFEAALKTANVEEAIATANTALNDDKVCTAEGREHFLKLFDNYKTEYDKIRTEKEAAYNAKVKSELDGALKDNAKYTDTAKNMAACQKALTDRLNTVKANIEGLKALALANETEHNNQVKASKDANAEWQNVFDDVTGKEFSSAQEAAITKLTEIKAELAAYDKAVEEAFAAGECDTKKAELETMLKASTDAIKALSDGWESVYNEAVAKDNIDRKNRFNNAYAALLDTYQDKTSLVNKLSRLSYAAGEDETLIDITGENGIFSYIEKIRALSVDAEETFHATEPGQLWDAEEKFTRTATDYDKVIVDFATRYSNRVNEIAKATFNEAKATAQGKVNEAKVEMGRVLGFGISEDDLKNSVKDVQDIIDKANKTAAQDEDGNFTDSEFAYKLDSEILTDFATIDSKLEADKENAAVTTWNAAISSANTMAEAEYAEIETFGVNILVNGALAASYAENEKAYIDAAAEEWSKIAEGEKYVNYEPVREILEQFTNTVIEREVGQVDDKPVYESHTQAYWNAKDKEDERLANDALYNEMLAQVENLQTKHDAAAEYVHSMLILLNDNLNGRLNTVQIGIKNLRGRVESKKGVMTDYEKQMFYNDVKVQETAISFVYDDAVEAEKGEIGLAVGNLYKDYDLAAAKNINDTSIDKYKDVIKGYETENATIYNEFTVGIVIGYDEENNNAPIYKKDDNGKPVKLTLEEARIAYLDLEKRIGVTKSELTAIYDADLANNELAAVNEEVAKLEAALAEINGLLPDCHVPVVNDYQSEIDAFTADVTVLKNRVAEEAEDNTVLLYKDVNIRTAQKIADKYKNLASEITEAEMPYDVNDAVYTSLSEELKALQDKLDAVVNVAKNYEHKSYEDWTNPETEEIESIPSYDFYSRTIGAEIADEQARIDELNSKYELKSESEISGNIEACIDMAEMYMAGINALYTYYDVKNMFVSAKDMMNDIMYHHSIYEERFYTDGIYYGELSPAADGISNDLYFAYDFFRQVYNDGKCNHDIDGNYFIDPEDENQTVYESFDFMEQYPVIMAKFAKLEGDITQYRSDVYDKSSLYGDVDNNEKINVTDYNLVRNYIIGVEDVVNMLDNDAARFAAADVNRDKEINISDVVQIAQKIMTGKFVPEEEVVSVRLSALMPNQSVDNELTVTATGSGMRQTINIAIADIKDFVGAQMDIVLPAGVTVVSENGVGSHDLMSGNVDGVHRVLLSSLEGEVFGSNDLVTIEVEVSSDFKGGAIEVKNAKFSDINGKLYTIGNISNDGATGITELTLGEKVMSKVYSVSGQLMNGLKKGINIIVNSDGTTKKIYNK